MKTYQITENNITYDINIHDNYNKIWYLNGKIHREDGPACECVNGDKFWYKNGKMHREDGPAVEYASGIKYYWYNGEFLENINSNEEFKRYIKLLSIS